MLFHDLYNLSTDKSLTCIQYIPNKTRGVNDYVKLRDAHLVDFKISLFFFLQIVYMYEPVFSFLYFCELMQNGGIREKSIRVTGVSESSYELSFEVVYQLCFSPNSSQLWHTKEIPLYQENLTH